MPRLAPYAPAFILLIGCAALWNAHEQRAVPLSGSLGTILDTMPGYEVIGQTLGDEERRVAGMTDYVARTYVKDSTVAFTTLVSYYDRQTQGKTIHSPRNCLPGAGWEIVQHGTQLLTVDGASHVVNRYVLRNGPETAIAYYWYQGRQRVVANEYAVKWNLLRDAAVLGHTEEALVRVVVPLQPAVDASSAQTAMRAGDELATAISSRLIDEVARVLPPGRSRVGA